MEIGESLPYTFQHNMRKRLWDTWEFSIHVLMQTVDQYDRKLKFRSNFCWSLQMSTEGVKRFMEYMGNFIYGPM
jgi:hypothetical protein